MPKDDIASEIERILGEADTLIRTQLAAQGIETPHIVMAVTPASQVILRTNVPPEILRDFGEDLISVADDVGTTAGRDATSDETKH